MAPFARRCWLAVALFRMLLLTAAAKAQSPVAAVGGTVSDASGAPVPGATVTAHQQGTGASRAQQTDASGRYRLEKLEPGPYEVEASRSGFRTAVQRVTLRVGDDALLDFPLQVGQLSEQVEVVSTATALNRTGFEVGGSVGRTQISALPLNGRSFLELAQLQPGVTVVSVTNPGAFGNNYQRVLMSGAYYSQTRTSVDGSTVGDRFAGGTMQGTAGVGRGVQGLDLQSGPGDRCRRLRRDQCCHSTRNELHQRRRVPLLSEPGSGGVPRVAAPAWCAVARLRPAADRGQRRRSAGPRPGVLVRQLRAQRSGRGVCREQQPSDLLQVRWYLPQPAHIESRKHQTGRPRVRPAPGLVSNQHRSQPHERSSGGGGHALELAIRRQQSVPNPDRRHVHPHRKHDQRVAGVL